MKIFGYTIIKTAKLLHIYEKLAIFVTEKLRDKDRFNMKFNVTIQNVLPVQNGTSKNGKAYSRQSYVGVYDSTNPQYPKSIVFDVLGDKIGQFNIQPGGQYEVEVDFAAREWQGKYFLSANCWKATPIQQQAYGQPYAPQGYQQPIPTAQLYNGNPQNAQPVSAQPYQPQAPQSPYPTAQPLPPGAKEETDDLPF